MNRIALFALILKDIQGFLTDRRAVIMAIIAPILLASFMAMVLGGVSGDTGEPSPVDLRVNDQDQSGLSKQIVQALKEEKGLAPVEGTLDEVRTAVRTGKAVLAVVIPPGFGAQAAKSMFGPGEKPTLGLLYDPTRQAELGMVRGLLTQHIMQAVSASAMNPDSPAFAERETDIDASKTMSPLMRVALKSMFREIQRVQAQVKAGEDGPASSAALGMGVPFQTDEEPVTAGNVKQRQAVYSHAFGGMAVQFILFSAIEMGVSLLTERQRGVWKRLRAAPLSRLVLLGARVLSGAIIALFITCVVFGFGAIFFGIRIQGGAAGLLGFLAVATGYALTAATFGLLIAALGKTPQAARGVSILAVLMMVMLGGGWIPSQFFPGWLRSITPIIPTRWAIDGFDAATIRANSAIEMIGPSAVLVGFAALFGLMALARFRWEAE